MDASRSMRVASLVAEVAGREWEKGSMRETQAVKDGNVGSGIEKGMHGQGTRARRQDRSQTLGGETRQW